ncbi:MAG: TetR/AcrR family transcriptional regulator [Oscillospiraceae bacterium]|nr:TetR/AcrR family transcriptional regulator [Oscillospiraceae bacterium]
MRVVKEAEERRNEILDVAQRLFTAKGFDNTSTNDILNEIGIARGTLYYHFKSKEEILDAMIDRTTKQLVDKAKSIVYQKDVPVFERFTNMILTLNISNSSFGNEILRQVHKPQNALMHQKIEARLLAEVTPLITVLIEDGIKQGICSTDYPQEVAEMTFVYSNAVLDNLDKYNDDERNRKINGYIYNLERLLNMERGSMQKVILPVFQALSK